MKFELTPIGLVHAPHREAQNTPIQPRWAEGVGGTVEVFPQFAQGLRDLEGFERIWLLFCCDRAGIARLEVVPFRDTQTHGVFATRAPSRPNPIGLSCVRLLAVEDATLRGLGLDLLDSTPLLDIKPYLPDCDIFNVARIGRHAHARGARSADHRFAQGEPNQLP